MISLLVLQNHMDLLRGVLNSHSETCVTSTHVERVNDMTEEDEQEPMTIPVIKTELNESCVPVVSVTQICYGLYPELPSPTSVCPCETKI